MKLLRVSVDGELINNARSEAKQLLELSPDLADYPGLTLALERRLDQVDADYLRRS